MRIGIFDSGLGGLTIAKELFKKLPSYDYVYFGDTKNLPYGQKTPEQIYRLTKKAVDFLFKQNCKLIIIACNTSSALALRKIQQKYLPKKFPRRSVLGVIIPTLETENKHKKSEIIGVVGTTATVNSHIYKKELQKINSKTKIFELATPKLVPLIEANSLQKAEKLVKLYSTLLKKQNIQTLILGCTHYPILKNAFKKAMGKNVKIISQDEIIPGKLKDYLNNHPEIQSVLSKKSKRDFWITSYSNKFDSVAKRLFGKKLKFIISKY